MESIYTNLALFMGAKMGVLGLIMSCPPYLRSAMVRFPFNCKATTRLQEEQSSAASQGVREGPGGRGRASRGGGGKGQDCREDLLVSALCPCFQFLSYLK